MAKETTISTRVTEELAEKIDRLSEQLGRTRSWILHEALETYIASKLEFIDAIQEGLQDLEQGQVVDHAKMMADWSRRRNNHR
jgi:predicted transcriptional regulator